MTKTFALAAVLIVLSLFGATLTPILPSPVYAAEPAPPAAKTKHAEITVSGKVLETFDSGGYTYVQLNSNDKKLWAAMPKTPVKVGDELSLIPGFEMANFKSKTLNRTFDRIVFSSGPAGKQTPLSDEAIKMAHRGLPGETLNSAPKEAPKSPPVAKGTPETKITKASGPHAYTIAELYRNSKKLHKKPVVVRGRVVKVTTGILKRVWIHLEDGSGDAKKGTREIVATSQQKPASGDIVTISGTLFKDRDFGSGYRYKIIIEKAVVKP